MVSTTSIQDGGSQKLGDREGSATLLKRGKAAKWLAAIAQRFRTRATRLRVTHTSNAGNGKIRNWLVKEKDYEPGLGSGTPRTVYLPSLTDSCYFLSSFQMLTVQQEGVPRRRPDSHSPALAAKSLTCSLKYGHIAY